MDEDRLVIADELWQKIKPLLPGKSGDPGATGRDNRRFMEAVLWRVRTGPPRRPCHSVLRNGHRPDRPGHVSAQGGRDVAETQLPVRRLDLQVAQFAEIAHAELDHVVLQILRQDIYHMRRARFAHGADAV